MMTSTSTCSPDSVSGRLARLARIGLVAMFVIGFVVAISGCATPRQPPNYGGGGYGYNQTSWDTSDD